MSKKNRFATTRTTRLELSDGDWVEAKERLSNADQERLGVAGFKGKQEGDTVVFYVDGDEMAAGRLSAWLVDWSFRDEDDKPVKLTRDAIKALDPDTVKEIEAALDAHTEAMEAAKKAPSGRPTLVGKSA